MAYFTTLTHRLNKNFSTKVDELYQFFEVVGEGAFSIVHRAIFLPTGEEIAVKVIKEERTTSNVIELVK